MEQGNRWYPLQMQRMLEEEQVCAWQVARSCRIKTSLIMSTLGSIFPSLLYLASSLPLLFLSVFFSLLPFSEGLSSVSVTGDTEEKVTELLLSSNSHTNRNGCCINSYKILRQVL